MAVSPDGSKVYVTNNGSNNVSVIATATNAVTTISVGREPFGVAVSPDGSKVYVANYNDDVSVIATATNEVATISLPVLPSGAVAFGLFIQPAPKFAGTPGDSTCFGNSVAALVRQYRGLPRAAAALGYRSIPALQDAIVAFCRG